MESQAVLDKRYMQRCIELARKGAGRVSPNPMVGSVVVYKGKIVGQGYHRQYGKAHAEVNAIASVSDPSCLRESTLYVNLEPCSHWGKTHPCSQLIFDKQIPRVVVGVVDPFAAVAGRGIRMLQEAGVEVTVGVLVEECEELNKTFFTAHRKHRPFVTLKWAQSADGFLDAIRTLGDGRLPERLSSPISSIAVHALRSRVDAILVGYQTALLDNPKLTLRQWTGHMPLRVVIDPRGALPVSLALFDGMHPTLVFVEQLPQGAPRENVEYALLEGAESVTEQVLKALSIRKIEHLLVEGGSKTLQAFVDANMWDEARVEQSMRVIQAGVKAPVLHACCISHEQVDCSLVLHYKNDKSV